MVIFMHQSNTREAQEHPRAILEDESMSGGHSVLHMHQELSGPLHAQLFHVGRFLPYFSWLTPSYLPSEAF